MANNGILNGSNFGINRRANMCLKQNHMWIKIMTGKAEMSTQVIPGHSQHPCGLWNTGGTYFCFPMTPIPLRSSSIHPWETQAKELRGPTPLFKRGCSGQSRNQGGRTLLHTGECFSSAQQSWDLRACGSCSIPVSPRCSWVPPKVMAGLR